MADKIRLIWVQGVHGFAQIPKAHREQLIKWMLAKEILWDDAGILWLGREGEETYGRRNFLELFSVLCRRHCSRFCTDDRNSAMSMK